MGIVDAVVASIGNIRMDCGDLGGSPFPYFMYFREDASGIVDVVFDPASSPPGRKLTRMIDHCVLYYHDPERGLNVTFAHHGRVALGRRPVGT